MPVPYKLKQEVLDIYGPDKISHVIAELKLIKTRGPFDTRFGICGNVSKESKRFPLCHRLLSENWEHFSGHSLFPVPHPIKAPSIAFADSRISKWSKNTSYGKKRWEFLDYLIDSLEECIK
jgi:hypothetical protein